MTSDTMPSSCLCLTLPITHPGPDCLSPYLIVDLTGSKDCLKCGSKTNDIEEARWHEALEGHQHGLLPGKRGILRTQTGALPLCHHTPVPARSHLSVTLCAPSTPSPCIIKPVIPEANPSKQPAKTSLFSYSAMAPQVHHLLLTFRGKESGVCPFPSAKANLTLRGGQTVDPVISGSHPKSPPPRH